MLSTTDQTGTLLGRRVARDVDPDERYTRRLDPTRQIDLSELLSHSSSMLDITRQIKVARLSGSTRAIGNLTGTPYAAGAA